MKTVITIIEIGRYQQKDRDTLKLAECAVKLEIKTPVTLSLSARNLQNPQTTSRETDWRGVIHAYRPYLPVSDTTPVVTLLEGNTPLIPVPSIAAEIGKQVEVFVKYDGLNPTGSFKDRGMTMAVSKAKEAGAQAVICASTGNTSAAAAAYAARGGLQAFVLVPDGYIALGKLAQALLYGSQVMAIQGNFDACFQIVRQIADRYPVTLVNSVNPYRLEGQKTSAFEIVDRLGDAPDWLCIPVGNAGNISAYWMGFCQYHQNGLCQRLPKMMGFQAKGSAPMVLGETVSNPQTIATAIRIGNPANRKSAMATMEASQGEFNAVTDEEILAAYRMLAREEGIFCEPASAASIAGLLQQKDRIPTGAKVVCVLTGNGLKDPDTAIEHNQTKFHKGVDPTVEAVAQQMGF